MCGPAYSESNLNFRLVGVIQKPGTVREGILVLNIYLGKLEAKICSRTDTFYGSQTSKILAW